MTIVGFGAKALDWKYKVNDLRKFGLRRGDEMEISPEELEIWKRTLAGYGRGSYEGGKAFNTISSLWSEKPDWDVRMAFYGFTGETVIITDGYDRTILATEYRKLKREELIFPKDTKWVHVTRFLLRENSQLQCEVMLDMDIPFSIDIGANKGWEELSYLLSRAQVIFGSLEEFQEVTGEEEVEGAVKKFDLRSQNVIIRSTRDNCIFFFGKEEFTYLYKQSEYIVDPTGAGDAFNTGFLKAKLSGMSNWGAVKEGHRLATRVLLTWKSHL